MTDDELDFFMEDWESFSDTGVSRTCKMKKKGGRQTRQTSVIIWQITNPDFIPSEKVGKFFVVPPSRPKSILEYIEDGPLFDSVEDAKSYAQKLLDERIADFKAGRVNWWTNKRVIEK